MRLTTTKQTFAFAALILATLAVPSARATLSYVSDDLFIGFYQSGNSNKEYVINLGQASTFRDATTPFSLSINTANFNTDMIGAFGANWKTSSTSDGTATNNIFWGVVGTTQNTAVPPDAARLIYTSEPVGTVPKASSSQSTPANKIVGFQDYWRNSTGTPTPGTVTNSGIEDPTNANAFATMTAASFGSPLLFSPQIDSLSNPLDFFRVPQTISGVQAVTNEGQFAINLTSGLITFTPTVPEPTSMALVGTVLVSAAGSRRLRRRAVAP